MFLTVGICGGLRRFGVLAGHVRADRQGAVAGGRPSWIGSAIVGAMVAGLRFSGQPPEAVFLRQRSAAVLAAAAVSEVRATTQRVPCGVCPSSRGRSSSSSPRWTAGGGFAAVRAGDDDQRSGQWAGNSPTRCTTRTSITFQRPFASARPFSSALGHSRIVLDVIFDTASRGSHRGIRRETRDRADFKVAFGPAPRSRRPRRIQVWMRTVIASPPSRAGKNAISSPGSPAWSAGHFPVGRDAQRPRLRERGAPRRRGP